MSADNNEENIPLEDFEGNKSVNNTHEQDTCEQSGDRSEAYARCKKKQCYVIPLIIIIIIIPAIAVPVVLTSKGAVTQNETINNGDIDSSKLQGNGPNKTVDILNNLDKIPALIKQDGPCGVDCINCTVEVLGPKDSSASQGKSCEASFEPYIKNSSCYLCGDQCLTFESLSGGKTCERPFDCCVYAIMGNLNNYCGQDGQYICEYSSDRPVCDCPAGKIGRTCNQTYTQQVSCKCYKIDLQFSQQEQMVECNSKDRTTNSSVCQIYQTINNKRHNCICYQDKTLPKQDLCNSSIPHNIYSNSP